MINKHQLHWGLTFAAFLFLLLTTKVNAQTPTTFSVKSIVCPNVCKGERFYQVIFSSSGGVVSSTKGSVRNDTIVNIDPFPDYRLKVTVTATDGKVIEQEVVLPACDPIIPSPPLVGSINSCEGQALPPLVAFASQNTVVDWYLTATGGIPLLQNSLSFTPTQAGTYYAQARIVESGCVSFSRTAASLNVTKVMCVPVTLIKIAAR